MNHLVEEDAQRPEVDVVVIAGMEKHFRGHVLVGAAEGGARGAYVVSTPPEVAQFDVVGVVQ